MGGAWPCLPPLLRVPCLAHVCACDALGGFGERSFFVAHFLSSPITHISPPSSSIPPAPSLSLRPRHCVVLHHQVLKECISGYGLGGSSDALFGRGIYTKVLPAPYLAPI